MLTHILAFLAGLFLGSLMGFFVTALVSANNPYRRDDEQ